MLAIMAWSILGTQFCLELAFGVLFGLCFLSRAPLGTFFHLMMGTVALFPMLVAAVAPVLYGEAAWMNPVTLWSFGGMALAPILMGPVKARLRIIGALGATLCCGVAIVHVINSLPGIGGTAHLILGSLSAMATGLVAGGVGLAMVLGHWYLTVPQLPVDWLVKTNRLTAIAMLASAALLACSVVLFADDFANLNRPLLGMWGLFFLGTRVAVGLALPLLMAWMTAGSLRYGNTRSATGILYASTVLVLIGTAASISLQDSYGIPL